MNISYEWPLILFTLCMQAAVGIYVVSSITQWGETVRQERMRFLWPVAALGTVGVLASVLHLGTPTNALLTMTNLGSSWLSREILLTLLFAVAGLGAFALEMRGAGSRSFRNGWAVLTGLLGLALVYAMSMVYRSTAVPAWAHISTTVSFFATTGLIGTVAVFAGLSYWRGADESWGMRFLMSAALGMLALQMMTISSHAAYLATAGPQAQQTAAMLSGNMLLLLWTRVGLTVVGAAVFMPLVWYGWGSKPWISLSAKAGVMVALVGTGELLGRILFYATRVKIGL